jgi:HEPN domain-containing protein
VTNVSLAEAYLVKAQKRLKILGVLLAEAAYSDVVREAQELVELALKGMLRQVGIEPPKWHDVGDLLRVPRAISGAGR